jgi:UDP-glucose 4-epimerase
MLIGVTGASGFLGRAVVCRLAAGGHQVRAIVRSGGVDAATETRVVSDLATASDPVGLFAGCDAVIHLAARVHVIRETAADPAAEFMRINHDMTMNLAHAADRAGVRRFVHASSVAAIMSVLPSGMVANDSTEAAPQNPYGESKLAADRGLEAGGFEALSTVSLRLPTIYGPGVGAFFARLMRSAKLGIPLPIGGFDNRRSFLYLDNAADAFIAAAQGEGRGSFIVTDSPPMTTADLYRALLRAAGRADWVPALPQGPVKAVAQLLLGDRVSSLLGSSAFDGARFAETFGWKPPVAFADAIARTIAI